MPFNQIFFNHLLFKKTSYTDSGVTISIDSKKDENIFFFVLDNENKEDLKTHLGIGGEGQLLCDLLVYYTKEDKKILCLAEAKGRDVPHATEQIKNTYNALLKNLRKSCPCLITDCKWVAFIQMHNSSSCPPNKKVYTEKLEKETGLICRVEKKGFDAFLRKM